MGVLLHSGNLALADMDHAVGDVGERGIVRDEHNGLARVRARVLQKLEDSFARLVVEGTCRLVGQKHLRVLCERACDGHALLLAARELRGEIVDAMREAYFGKHLGGIEGVGANLACELDVFECCQVLHEIVKLEHEADVVTSVIRKLLLVERARRA